MPAGTGTLPPQARAALGDYLAALDHALPGAVCGVYLTGSAALGDWRPGRSDLDILTVTERRPGAAELAALAALHAGLPGRPYRDAVYVSAEAVGAQPAPDGDGPDAARLPSAVDGVFHRARRLPDPVLWATLDRHGLTARGPEPRSLGAGPGEDWLRDWNHGNMESYWRPWAASGRDTLAGLDPAGPLPGAIVAWAVLGPGRLHATITTGEIISKTAAAGYTARLLPRHAPLLARARAHRLGDDTAPFTVADGLAACDLIEAVADQAAALRDGAR